MEVKELMLILRKLPQNYEVMLVNYFDDNKQSDSGEIECLEGVNKNIKTVTFRIKPEVRYS